MSNFNFDYINKNETGFVKKIKNMINSGEITIIYHGFNHIELIIEASNLNNSYRLYSKSFSGLESQLSKLIEIRK